MFQSKDYDCIRKYEGILEHSFEDIIDVFQEYSSNMHIV